MYGLSNEGGSENLAINMDYNKPVLQVYAEVTRFFFHGLGHADLFLARGQSRNDLPTWTLNFKSMELPCLDGFINTEGSSRYLVPHMRSFVLYNVDWTVLSLHGCHLATITALQSTLSELSGKAVLEPKWYVKRFFSHLSEAYVAKTVVDASPTQCLQNWILRTYPDGVEWGRASRELSDYSERMQVSFKQKTLKQLERINYGDTASVPQYYVDSYVKRSRAWGIVGIPEVSDLIVVFRATDFAVVLRKSSESAYSCVGSTRPLTSLMLEAWRPHQAPEDESFKELWMRTRIPYLSRLTPDGRSLEDEQVFQIQ